MGLWLFGNFSYLPVEWALVAGSFVAAGAFEREQSVVAQEDIAVAAVVSGKIVGLENRFQEQLHRKNQLVVAKLLSSDLELD